MTISQGQTTYSLEMPVGYPGQVLDRTKAYIRSYPCASGVSINPGQALMLASDGVSVTPLSGTLSGATVQAAALAGIACLDEARQAPDTSGIVGSGGNTSGSGVTYAAGDMVPVIMRGCVFANQYSAGTTAVPQLTNTGLHLNCSSSPASGTSPSNIQGSFTTDALSQTVGSEISIVPFGVCSVPPAIPVVAATLGLVLVELCLPSNGGPAT